MRPMPWTIRVGLFAVGFGAGLSHYKAPSTPQPVIIELHLEANTLKTAWTLDPSAPAYSPCQKPASDSQLLFARN